MRLLVATLIGAALAAAAVARAGVRRVSGGAGVRVKVDVARKDGLMDTRLLRLTQVLLVVLLVPQFAQALVDTAWVRRYDGPAHADDWATALAVDSAGNVYVAGVSYGTGADFVTIKYYPNGDTAWVRRRDFFGDDAPSGLAVDAQGNVYVSGTAGNNRIATVKYSSIGQPVWTRMFGTRAQGNGLGLDAEGNVIVVGDTLTPPPTTTSDVAVLKYLPNGDTAWARFYDWAGFDDAADVMALTEQGDICIAGWCSDTVPGGNLLAIRWSGVGERLWVAVYDGPLRGAETARDVAVDHQRNVVVTGVADRGYGTPFDYLTIRYSPLGETTWVRRHNGTADGWDQANAVAADVAGNVCVTGYARNSETGNDCVTIKYSPDGEVVWIAEYNGPANSSDGGLALAVDSLGYVCVAGVSYRVAPVQSDGLLLKYNPEGETMWVRRYSSSDIDDEQFTTCAVDRAGSVYVAGSTSSRSQGLDIIVAKYREFGGVEERPPSSARTTLPALEARPSPFTARTAISFRVADMVKANVVAFDAAGRPVRTLTEGRLPAGVHVVVWDRADDDGQRVPAGVYTIRLTAEQTNQSLKVLVMD